MTTCELTTPRRARAEPRPPGALAARARADRRPVRRVQRRSPDRRRRPATAPAHARDLLRPRAAAAPRHRGAGQRRPVRPGHRSPCSPSYWYSLLHYVVTPAVLIWVYRRHRGDYRQVRNALVLASAIGLVGFTLLPMAPPRMLPGFVDTLAATSGVGWWGGDASAPRGLGEPHQPAGRDAVAARRLGGLGRLGRLPAGTRRWVRPLALGLPGGHDPRRRGHRQPLPARRGGRRPRGRGRRSGCPAGSRSRARRAAGASRSEPASARESSASGSSKPGSGSVVLSTFRPAAVEQGDHRAAGARRAGAREDHHHGPAGAAPAAAGPAGPPAGRPGCPRRWGTARRWGPAG